MEKKSRIIDSAKRRKVLTSIMKAIAGFAILNLVPIKIAAKPVKKKEGKKIKAIEHPLAVKYGARKVNGDE